MMKKNALALGVAVAVGSLGFASVASAGVIAGGAFTLPSGGPATPSATNATKFLYNGTTRTGHILVGEYFTSQAGNVTTLHIVNTDTVNGKAVKVRFRGAANSDDIFDFTVLMSPGDVWTGGVVADAATKRSKLVTADTTCTLPPVVNGELFLTDRLPLNNKLTDDQLAAMTREGYVEILNMADIPPSSSDIYKTNTDAAGKAGALYRTIKHSSGKAACDFAVLKELTKDPTTMQDAAKLGLDVPSGGLFANLSVINVANTASYASQAHALQAANAAGQSSTGNIVFFPQTADDAKDVNKYTADPLLRTDHVLKSDKTAMAGLPLLKAQMFDLPDLSTPYLSLAGAVASTDPVDQAVALTGAFTKAAVINEFNVEPGLDAATDWVFSMPTRRYHVAMDYNKDARNITGFDGRVFLADTAGTDFSSTPFNADNTSVADDKLKICVKAGDIDQFDREENTKASGFVISPGTAKSVRFCGETSVLSFKLDTGSANPSVLGSTEAYQILGTPYQNGWAKLGVNNAPVIGSAYIRLVNTGARPGVSGNYGLVFPHR